MFKKSIRIQGFTLVELMITVAILSIMMGVALPSYMEQIRKGHRTEAKVELLRLAQTQESYFTQNLSYAKNLSQLGLSSNTFDTENAYYSVTLGSVTPGGCTGTSAAPSCTGFMIQATAQNAQSSDSDCPRFTLTNTGLKGTASGASVDAVRKCWK